MSCKEIYLYVTYLHYLAYSVFTVASEYDPDSWLLDIYLDKIRMVCKWNTAELAEALINFAVTSDEQLERTINMTIAKGSEFKSHICGARYVSDDGGKQESLFYLKAKAFAKNMKAKSKELFVVHSKALKESDEEGMTYAQKLYATRESHELHLGFCLGHHLTKYRGTDVSLVCFNLGDPTDVLTAAFVANYTIEGL